MRTRTLAIGLGVVAVAAVLAILLVPQLLQPEQRAVQEWPRSTPEEQGLDSIKLADGLQALWDKDLPIDSLLIVRNGHLVLDAYFYPYDDSVPHKLASVTKSVMTILIGIAVDQGKIELDQPLLSFFPDRTIANLDARKEHVTVRHLVSMRNGFQSGCLAGDEQTLNAMRANPDWVQAALDRKVVREPGTAFCYDSPGMHLLSAILQEATGMTAFEFARQNLFEPLGIREVYWQPDPEGYSHGWGDLYLTPRDAAKIGQLWLGGGVWEGKQVVSASWVKDSVQALSSGGMDQYGYGWWVSDDNYYAMGRGGQTIKVHPAYDAVVVTTAHGLEYDQIVPLLTDAFVSPDQPLPANPDGVAKLDATVDTLAQAPHPWPTGPLPDQAKVISGETYVLEPNAIDLATVKLEFDDAAQATITLQLQGHEQVWPVGLDGSYRLGPDGQGLRGYWADRETFALEIFQEGLTVRRLRFEDDRVEINFPELGSTIKGRQAHP